MDSIYEDIHAKVLGKLKHVLGDIHTYDEYPKGVQKNIPLPAVFNELVFMEPSHDQDVTDTLTLTCQWETRIIVSTKNDQKRRRIWEMVSRTIKALHEEYWDRADTKPAIVTGSMDEGLDPKADGYEIWKIDWSQDVRISEEDQDPLEGWSPDEVALGWYPGDEAREHYTTEKIKKR